MSGTTTEELIEAEDLIEYGNQNYVRVELRADHRLRGKLDAGSHS